MHIIVRTSVKGKFLTLLPTYLLMEVTTWSAEKHVVFKGENHVFLLSLQLFIENQLYDYAVHMHRKQQF